MEARLSWLIIGTGAIGTYIGGSLTLHGQNVCFLEQSADVPAIIENGLRLNLQGQEHRILHPVIFSNIPDALTDKTYDVAVLAVKSYDTAHLIETLQPYAEYLPPVLCVQNGVENETALERALGKEKVIAGTVTSSILRRAAGDIVVERQRGTGIADTHPLSHQLAEALSSADLNPRLYAFPAAMKWSKMLTNLLANASSAILDMPPSAILSSPSLYAIEIKQLREALSICRANHIRIVDLPKVPVRAFSRAVNDLPPWFSRLFLARMAGAGRGGKMPSFHMDLYSKRGKSEVDYLNGAVVRSGKQANIATPINEWLNSTLQRIVQGSLPLEFYAHKPEKFWGDLQQFLKNQSTTTN